MHAIDALFLGLQELPQRAGGLRREVLEGHVLDVLGLQRVVGPQETLTKIKPELDSSF